MNEHFDPLDKDTGGRIVIDSNHNAVHEGRMFGFHIENLAATAATVINVHYRTGDEEVHLDAVRQALGGRVQTIFYENAIVSMLGSAIVPIKNKNRNYPDTDGMTIRTDTTFSAVGSALSTTQILADSTNQSKQTSSIKDTVEWVLKPNSDYLARTTFAANTIYTMDGLFYHEKKEVE
ncbi:MAG: hypothetical protein ABFD50_20595 [Smithella sp.]